ASWLEQFSQIVRVTFRPCKWSSHRFTRHDPAATHQSRHGRASSRTTYIHASRPLRVDAGPCPTNAGKGQSYRRHYADEICCSAVRLVVAHRDAPRSVSATVAFGAKPTFFGIATIREQR